MPSVWLKDVAKAAGVSISAASHAINQTGTLSAKTRAHVVATAKQLGYRKSPLLSAIAMRRFQPTSHYLPIGMLSLRGGEHGGFSAPVETLRKEAEVLGMTCLETACVDSRKTLLHYLAECRAQGVEGILLGHAFQPEWVEGDDFEAFSVLAAGDIKGRFPFHRVEPDWFMAVADCYEKLRASGCGRIGAVFEVQHPISEHDLMREGAFLASARKFNAEPLLIELDTVSDVVPWFHRTCPDGLICFTMPTAYALLESGVRAPQDVQIALTYKSDFTDRWYAQFAGPYFSYEEIARRSCQVMYNLITHRERGQPAFPQIIKLHMPWSPGPSLKNDSGSSFAEEASD